LIRLILFDIDGTLVLTGGAGVRATERAFRDVFDYTDGLTSVSMAGRTDAWIVAEMAALHGRTVDDARIGLFKKVYVRYLSEEIEQPGPRKGILPGVRPLLDQLASSGELYLGLLTGNFHEGARIKLQYFDLWRYFGAGAFGDAAHDRNGLLWKAMAAVEQSGGPHVRPSEVVIIGDTPLDVAVAVAGGARSIAVATGSYDVKTLLESGADVALPDLSDRQVVLEALERLS
jgi:phosphoglycolate phosphatase-like HAD superfamily hydrolase